MVGLVMIGISGFVWLPFAPAGGVLLKRYRESEQVLAAGTPLVEIGDLARLEVEADFLSEDVAHMKVGMAAETEVSEAMRAERAAHLAEGRRLAGRRRLRHRRPAGVELAERRRRRPAAAGGVRGQLRVHLVTPPTLAFPRVGHGLLGERRGAVVVVAADPLSTATGMYRSGRLQQQPDDLKGWVMLARSYAIMKRYSEAEAAYANVLRLGGENADLLTDYADTMVMADGGAFNDESAALLLRALELEPDNLKALWLAGHWKNQSGEHQEAIDYWQRAAAKLPPGSKDIAVITSQINELQAKLGIQTEPAPTPAPTVATAGTGQSASLTVQVTLDPNVAAATSPEDTVFIFARAAQGPRMPLAIVRTQVKDLPATVTLDDSMAMTPQMVLSNFDQVTVGARVSKSGGAMPVSGDLQGIVTPVDSQTSEPVQVTIDSKVP